MKPYDRAAVLSKFEFLDLRQKLSSNRLQREYGLRAAIRVIAGTKREIQRVLDIEISRGQAGNWLYDINRHLNLAHALQSERKLGAGLIKLVLAQRAREAAELMKEAA